MATVVDPKTGDRPAELRARGQALRVERRRLSAPAGQPQGKVEKSIHFATQRFWRTMTATTIDEAQRQLDRFCERIGDKRPRSHRQARRAASARRPPSRSWPRADGSVRAWATWPNSKRLRPLPPPVTRRPIEEHNTVGPSALVAFEGNAYSVPPGLIGAEVTRAPSPGHRRHRDRLARRDTPGQPPARDPRRRLRGARPGPQGRPRARGAGRLHHRPAVSEKGQPPTRRGGPGRGGQAAGRASRTTRSSSPWPPIRASSTTWRRDSEVQA